MFEYLQKAALHRDGHIPWAMIDPLYKRYRSDPRFISLKKKVGI